MAETFADRTKRRLETAGINPAELISIGYEIASSNDENMSDAGEALRIYVERTGYQFPDPLPEYAEEVEAEIYELFCIEGLITDEDDDIPGCFGFTHQYTDIG